MTREARIATGVVVGLGAFIFMLLVVGNQGERRAELDVTPVADVLAGADTPADRFGQEELRIVGWYAELGADCVGDDGGSDASVAWLQRDCPLRVLLPEQPDADVTQSELESAGLRLAAPQGGAFPSRPEPAGANLQLQQLVFVGHFADAAASRCVPERSERCRNAFVVDDYDGYVR